MPILDSNLGQIHYATTPDDGHFLADHIPGARYAELNGAHLCNIEDAQAFTLTVCSFLNSQ